MMPAAIPDAFFHIRRLNPKRDLNDVANLIEDAFSLKGDPEGAWVLRQMRAYAARANSYPEFLELPGAPDGFVWEENGKIIANISLVNYSQADKQIILIANVAVAQDFRRRGIASALTRHALRFISQRPRAEVWLQVRSDNQAAIQLYSAFAFEFVHALSQWRWEPARLFPGRISASLSKGPQVGARKIRDWKFQKAWLAQNYPAQTRWYLNANPDYFSPWAFLMPPAWQTLPALRHLALRETEELLGVLTWQKTSLSADQLWLALPDNQHEDARAAALLQALQEKMQPTRPLLLEYPRGKAQPGIQSAGFTLARNLDWMKLKSPL